MIRRMVCSLPLDGEIRDPVLQIVILDILCGHLPNAIFLQDGAKPYTADDILSLLRLRNMLKNRVIQIASLNFSIMVGMG